MSAAQSVGESDEQTDDVERLISELEDKERADDDADNGNDEDVTVDE